MERVDFTKDVTNMIFRGAESGIAKMHSSCFFTYEEELATDYAEMNDNPCLYAFDISGLKLMEVERNEDLDFGIDWITEEEYSQYDGIRTESYSQTVFFGEFDCTNGKFTKSTYEEVIKQAESEIRRYDR